MPRTRSTRADLPFEFMLNALRLVDGFALDLFTQRTGSPVTVITGELDRAAERRAWSNATMRTCVPPRAAGDS